MTNSSVKRLQNNAPPPSLILFKYYNKKGMSWLNKHEPGNTLRALSFGKNVLT